MNIIEKAIWQVETHLRMPATLDAIAERAGVTPSYLTRAFALATGQSLMRYARARRLSEAARVLALGVPDILGLALDVGYGSHEAFTRAFREHFGVTPETVRDARSIKNLELTEPLAMDQPLHPRLADPRIEDCKALLLAGLIKTFPMKDVASIPSLWAQFNQIQGAITNTGPDSYEVVERITEAGAVSEQVRPLGLAFPAGIFSLSHVALPFPMNDSLYGMQPDDSDEFGVNLGAIAPRGERGVLILNLDALLRASSNPFYPYLMERIEEWMDQPGSPKP